MRHSTPLLTFEQIKMFLLFPLHHSLMSIASERKRPSVLPEDIIYPIVDLVALNFDIENLDLYVRSQRRLRREYYCAELLNLRVVSRTFCRIVSPRVFRALKLTHTVSSITNFLAIIQSPRVRHHVEAVRYGYWDPGECNHNARHSGLTVIG